VFSARVKWDHGGGGFRWSNEAKRIELGLGHDAAGDSVNNSHLRKVGIVFAFVVGGADEPRRPRCGNIGPRPFPEPAREVFGLLAGGEPRNRYPCLVSPVGL
jgi:hypothetical protein